MKTCAFIYLGYWVMHIHVGVKLLDHRADVCFLETAKLFYKEVIRHILLIQQTVARPPKGHAGSCRGEGRG